MKFVFPAFPRVYLPVRQLSVVKPVINVDFVLKDVEYTYYVYKRSSNFDFA